MPGLREFVQPEPPPLTSSISRDELMEIEKGATNFNLLPLFYLQLKKHYGSDRTVSAYLKEKKSQISLCVAGSARQELLEDRLLQLLHESGIPACIIKGNDLAKRIYCEPESRLSADIDVLIRARDVTPADRILNEHGYFRGDSLPLDFWAGRLHHAQYFHKDDHRCIEVHWNFIYQSLFSISSDDIWNEIGCDESGHNLLAPDMMLVMLICHHFRHAFSELRILVDILWALKRYEDEIDWRLFVTTCKNFGMTRTLGIIIKQLVNIWPEATKEMKSVNIISDILPAEKNIIADYFSEKLNRAESGPSDAGTKDYMLCRLLPDSRKAIVRAYIMTLLPSPSSLRLLYGNADKIRLPFYYVRFVSWRLREWMGRLI